MPTKNEEILKELENLYQVIENRELKIRKELKYFKKIKLKTIELKAIFLATENTTKLK
jgi:hypothetical protein